MLNAIWFYIWGITWAIYFILDGFDLGLGSLYPFLGKDEKTKNTIINSIGPFWDGNEVWLITAGGITFAAFPKTYAVMFSAMYSPLMILLFALIIRGISLEFRNQLKTEFWRKIWDNAFFIGSVIPSVILGVAFANIFKGIPINSKGVFEGNILTFLGPYCLLGGVFFLFLFLVHGAVWLSLKAGNDLKEKSENTASALWYFEFVLAVMFLIYSWFKTGLYKNYIKNPVLLIVPLITVVSMVLIKIFIQKGLLLKAWIASAITILGTTFFGLIGLFPKMLPSTISSKFSLTAYNSVSSPLTLKIMLAVVLIFIPLVLIYQSWIYVIFKGKASTEPHY